MIARGALPAQEVAAWAQSAEPGAQLPYAWGDPDFPRATPGARAAVELVTAGMATAFMRTISAGRREYVLRRVAQRAREREQGGAPAALGGFYHGPNSAAGLVLERLRHEAAAGLPCSTNAELDALLLARGFDGPSAAYLVRRLSGHSLIRVEMFGPGQRRRVTIIASGARTGVERG